MSTESVPEIIEIIDVDGDPFHESTTRAHEHRPSSDRGDVDRSAPKWATPVAGAALVALIGFAVVSSATSPGTTVPTAATLAPTTTAQPVTASTTALVTPQYYLADPAPDGFTMHFAKTLGDDGAAGDLAETGAPAELWATQDASATTGSWFVVSTGSHHSTGRNAYRTAVGDTGVVVEHDPSSGQSRLSFTKEGADMEITAFGWADRQLLRLVASAHVQNSVIRYSDTFFTSDHTLVLHADPTTAVEGLRVASVGYTTGPDVLGQSFTVTVAGFDPVNHEVETRFAIRDSHAFDLGRRSGIVGRWAADPNLTIVQFRDGPYLITVRGDLDRDTLMSIASTVQRNSAVISAAVLDDPTPPSRLPPLGSPHTIASGMLADGWPWTIQVAARDVDDTSSGYVWGIGQPGELTRPDLRLSTLDDPSIETIVEHGRTYILAKVPRAMAGAQLHVNPNGLPSAVMDVLDLDPSLADLFTAYVFIEPVAYTAQIVDAAGTTVAAWPPPS